MKNKEAEKILTKVKCITLSEFPSDITLKYDEEEATLTIELRAEAAGLGKGKSINMQNDAAAFEAWALIIKAEADYRKKNLKKIVLDVKGVSDSDYNVEKPSNDCLGRFLYRILKFKEQYGEWFELSDILKGYKDNFISYLSGEHEFKNNVPGGEAETNEDKLWNKGLEKYVEWKFCTDNELKENILGLAKDTVIDRQLPVGLYEDEVKKDNVVFTGRSAAIDFWTLDDKEKAINVYELKTKSKMVGILTEIFFYSNYVRDVYWHKTLQKERCNVKLKSPKTTYRSYDKLCSISDDVGKITGWLLADEFHPAITEKVLELMNKNTIQEELQYKMKRYKINMDFSSVNGE